MFKDKKILYVRIAADGNFIYYNHLRLGFCSEIMYTVLRLSIVIS